MKPCCHCYRDILFSHFTSLVTLEMGVNQFSRHQLPAEITQLSNLKTLGLSLANLFGTLPTELSDLRRLQKLIISQNDFTGRLPTELALIQGLNTISVGANRLTGGIPSELGTLTELEVLDLTRNRFSFELPSELGLLTNLVELSLASNALTGVIPDEICNLWEYNLQWLGNSKTDFLCGSRTYGGAICPPDDPECCRNCQSF
jgi:Leucine-rich repeat (LRR) protein